MKTIFRSVVLSSLILILSFPAAAQKLTGTWEGGAKSKIPGRNTKIDLEVKLVMKGNKVMGTTYHYEGPGFHHRYSVSGEYNPTTQEITWKEETLLLEQSPQFFYYDPKEDRRIYKGKVFFGADSSMTIEGDLIVQFDTTKSMAMVIRKNDKPSIFNDEWDYIIEKSSDKITVADIDSIAAVAKPFNKKDYEELMKQYLKDKREEAKLAKQNKNKRVDYDSLRAAKANEALVELERTKRLKAEQKAREDSTKQAIALAKDIAMKEEQIRKEKDKAKQDSIRVAIKQAKEQAAKDELARKLALQKEQKTEDSLRLVTANAAIKKKFDERKKTLITEIPLQGDSIEIRLFDNGVVDGDSISLFLNNQLYEKNIGLLSRAHVIKIAVNSLPANCELTMVAENMGTIPPNTAMMIVLSGEERYQVRLESTESSSAMVRFVKKKK